MQQASLYTADDGIKAYSKVSLSFYDPFVIRGLAPCVWNCSPADILDHYREHVTANHADIGVGTGYFLDRCDFGQREPRIALIDLQPASLAHATRRLARYRPEIYVRDARTPLVGIPAFDSICLGGILHCLPGYGLQQKSAALRALKPIAHPGTKVFGYTLVSDHIRENWRRTLTHCCLRRLRVVNFANDRIDDLANILRAQFIDSKVEPVGCFAFFSAVVPDTFPDHSPTQRLHV